MPSPILLNGLSVNWARIFIPNTGVWFADLEIDPGLLDTSVAAKLITDGAPAVLVVGFTLMKGAIDGSLSGQFADFLRVRVVGGQGNWSKPVRPQHFNSPAGLIPAQLVYAATAAEVKELPPIDANATMFGGDYVRFAGPASNVFGDNDWHLDLTTGIAQVGLPWKGSLPDSAIVLSFDPDTRVMQLAVSDPQIVTPGTSVTDDRFGGLAYTIRDVDMTFDGQGSRITAWCSDNPVSRLANAMKSLVRKYAKTSKARLHKYTVVSQAGQKLALQSRDPEAPSLVPLTEWTGSAGVLAQLTPGTSVLVAVVDDTPFLVATDGTPPLLITAFAPSVTLGSPAGVPLATAPALIALVAALETFAGAAAVAITAAQIATAAGTLATSLSALPVPATVLTKAS